ncbi:hypothetical protein FGG08_001022 [Glutinoglossum americanum]|uniref:Bromo domain-containing protein n=1 Tax=Glutinoglossum americanum TaxID=1670608 RepID=A0A9P8IHC9_9PEZI|nr:hypothetical protein FGG08_001022 [Glutinoglossum americanum]
MNTLTAYTPLESLLLFQSLATHGAEPSAFSKISDLLKGNPLVRQAKTFDTGRLSPDALRELYLSLLKEDSSSEAVRNGGLEQPGDEGQSNSRKRKLQTPPLPDISHQTQRLPQLVKRLYARYIENITKLIREDERRYQGLQQEVEEIQRGELDEGLRKRESPEPAAPTNARGDSEPIAPQNALETPIPINELSIQTDKAAEATPEPGRTNFEEDVNGTTRDERSKSAASGIPPNASPAPPPSPGTAVESSPSPQAPITSPSEQAAKANEGQENAIIKLSTRSRTPQAQTPARARSTEPRISNYSRHYVTATPAAQPPHPRTPRQPELAESPSPNLTIAPSAPTLGKVDQSEGLPSVLSENQSNTPLSHEPQVHQPHDQNAPSSAPSPTPAQSSTETATAMTASEVLPPQVHGQIAESPVRLIDIADEQRQAASTITSDQDQFPAITNQQKGHPASPTLRTPAPPEQDVPLNNAPPQDTEHTPSLPLIPSTPSSVVRAQGHPTSSESIPQEPGKQYPQEHGSPTKQDVVQSTPSSAEATRQLSPRLSTTHTPALIVNTRQSPFTTPVFNKKGPRPPPIDTSAMTNRSFKPFDRGLISGSPGSPVRPGPDEISPISAPSSPILFPKLAEPEPPSITKGKGKRQRETSMDASGRAEEDDADELETRKTRSGRTPNVTGVKSRRTRAESAASSAIPPPTRARSRSIISHTDELSMDHETINRSKVKHEQPPTSSRTSTNVGADKGGETTADEGTRQRRGKRKEPDDVEVRVPKPKRTEDPLGAPDMHRTPEPTTSAPQYVLSTRNFARTSATIMNDIGQHKYASIFSSPVKEKDAPGYKDLIHRPQDLKSIKSAIAAGGKAVAAAVGAVSVSGGTPTENLPSPGPVGTATAKNTSLWIPISPEVVPPKGIINSAQLEKELMRMFANAVMFNPGPDRGFGPAFREKAEDGQEEDEEKIEEDEDGGVVKDTREMFAVVERAVTDWRAAERAVESLSGKPPSGGAGAGRPRPEVVGKEREEKADETLATAAAAASTVATAAAAAAAAAAATAAADGKTEDKDDGEGTTGTARKRRRL